MAITAKEINLVQLDQELGSQGLCADFNDPKKKVVIQAENSTVTDIELEAAIKAHIAKPTQDQITKLNREQGLLKMKELGFTDDQISALIG